LIIYVGGIPSSKGMISEPLPSWLIELSSKLKNLAETIEELKDLPQINHVLINEYLQGQGIMVI
jgi:alkylated DNA repair protein alkB family protein 6